MVDARPNVSRVRRDRDGKFSYGEHVTRAGQGDRGGFANAIRAARARSGLTLTQAAEESGVSRATIARWESGDITEPSIAQLKAFIAATDALSEEIMRALDLLPAQAEAEPVATTLADFTDAELIAELQRRDAARTSATESGRRTA